MSTETDNEDAYAPDNGEKAFTESGAKMLGDLELQPWTPARQVAAQSLGLKFPYISDEDREQLDKTGIYPGALSDTAIVLYLASLADDTPDGISKGRGLRAKDKVLRALRKPSESLEAAIEWAHARGITNVKDPAFWDAYNTFISIVTEANAQRSERKDAGGGGNGSTQDPN